MPMDNPSYIIFGYVKNPGLFLGVLLQREKKGSCIAILANMDTILNIVEVLALYPSHLLSDL